MFMSLIRRRATQPSALRPYTTRAKVTHHPQPHHGTTHSSSTPRRPLSNWALLTGFSLSSLTFYSLGAFLPQPDTPLSILYPRAAPPPPDPDSEASIVYTETLEAALQQLPEIKAHRELTNAEEWYETRPYAWFPPEKRANNLCAGSLRGKGRLALPPLVRCKKDESESIIWVHVGRSLCGHDGIVHGGMLATLLDEALGRVAINNLPDKVGVTANLQINYKAPTKADQFIVIKASLISAKGRKVNVKAQIEDLQGTVLAEATALFVQPRYAKLLNRETLKQAMGEPIEPVKTA